MEKHNIKFKEILDFLNTYTGHSYNKPENIDDEMHKQQILIYVGKLNKLLNNLKKSENILKVTVIHLIPI